jgi:hypothetical protein
VRGKAAFIAVFLYAAPAGAEPWAWHEALTPHFQVKHEEAFMPPGFTMGLEKIHGRLRLDLAMFSPWMSKERLKLYVYAGKQSYVKGEFQPPDWSNGIAMYNQRTVVVYEQPRKEKLLQIIAHETTHLLFEGYWGEVGKQPPQWLNEGLAMMEETDAATPERSDWFGAMVNMKKMMKLDKLFTIAPTQDLAKASDKDVVDVFYTQSYALVYFLFRTHTKLQFKSFVADLRDGIPVEKALWNTYRYHTLEEFEAAWKRWLKDPSLQRKLDKQPLSASFDFEEKRKFGAIKDFKPLEKK